MNTIQCGFAQRVITPEKNMPMGGFYREYPSKGVRDNLFVKAAVFKTGDDVFALLSFDATEFYTEHIAILKEKITRETGLSPDKVMIHATHTHSAPLIEIPPEQPEVAAYWHETGVKAGQAINQALAELEEGTLSVRTAAVEFPVNRREQTVDGITLGENPDAYCNRQVKVCVFQTVSGKISGMIVHMACHCVCLNGESLVFSADYPGVLYTGMQEEMPDAVVLFVNGAMADVNPRGHNRWLDNEKVLQNAGSQLLGAVKAAIHEPPVYTGMVYRLRSACEEMDVPLDPTASVPELTQTIDLLQQQYRDTERNIFKQILHAQITWYEQVLAFKKTVEISAIRVVLQAFSPCEGMVFAGIPFEIITETGRRIEEKLGGEKAVQSGIFIASCTDACNTYLVTKEIKQGGGYEPKAHIGALPWGLSDDAEPKVVEAITRMAAGLL